MPEYLAPGVYVEEVSFRSKSIEGVGTTTAAFIGPTRYGPVDMEPEVLTSLGEFERIYGDGQQLKFSDQAKPMHNYLWHAVRAYFEEGGQRLYVQRIFRPIEEPDPADPEKTIITSDGYARAILPADTVEADPNADDYETRYPGGVHIRARFPGRLGQLRLRLTLALGQNLLSFDQEAKRPTAQALQPAEVVWINDLGSPIESPLGSPISSPLGQTTTSSGRFYLAKTEFDQVEKRDIWWFYDESGIKSFSLDQLSPNINPSLSDQVRPVRVTLTVMPSDPFGLPAVWSDLALDPGHKEVGTGRPNDFASIFAANPANRANAYRLPVVVTLGDDLDTGLQVLKALVAALEDSQPGKDVLNSLADPNSLPDLRSFDFMLEGGDDGMRPSVGEYAGKDDPNLTYKTGLESLKDIEDISTIAAPGATLGFENGFGAQARTINGLLIAHAENMRYRMAVLDSGDRQTISQVRAMRAEISSKYAALYYPWVRVFDQITGTEIYLPPSGFVAGIFARNDVNRAVYKAPANEVVRLALGFELLLNKGQQEVLNPEGINCFRYFEGRGRLLWGARTISSDPEWKYVNLRRYFNYLEHSIDKGTQWAVFEPNGERLWANVRRTIEDFLLNEWQSGALLGDKPEKAYFVRCDRSTMTQNDLDNGRLIVLIGVAPLRPAEFVIFRIGQWTADAKR